MRDSASASLRAGLERNLMYSADFKRRAVEDARIFGRRATARGYGLAIQTLRRWVREDDLRRAQPTLDEVALLKRDDLTAKDLPAVTAIRSRSTNYLIGAPPDDDDLPPRTPTPPRAA